MDELEPKKTRRSARGVVTRKAFSPEPGIIKERRKSDQEKDVKKAKKRKTVDDDESSSSDFQKSGSLGEPPRLSLPDEQIVRITQSENEGEEVDVVTVEEEYSEGEDDETSSFYGDSPPNLSRFNPFASLMLPELISVGNDSCGYMFQRFSELMMQVVNPSKIEGERVEMNLIVPKAESQKCIASKAECMLLKKAQGVANDFIFVLSQTPLQYPIVRIPFDEIIKAMAITFDLFETYCPGLDILQVLKQQNVVEEVMGQKNVGDAVIHNVSVFHARFLIEHVVFNKMLARIHTWLVYRLEPKYLRSYLILCKHIATLDQRWSFFFASDPRNYAFRILDSFLNEPVIDPFSNLLCTTKPIDHKNNTPRIVVAFEGVPDDKLGLIGMICRGFHSIGCAISTFASLDDKKLVSFVKGVRWSHPSPSNAMIFVAKIELESTLSAPRSGTLCFVPKIEMEFVSKRKDKESPVKILSFCCRTNKNEIVSYNDLAFNGLTSAVLIRSFLERAMIFMKDCIPPLVFM